MVRRRRLGYPGVHRDQVAEPYVVYALAGCDGGRCRRRRIDTQGDKGIDKPGGFDVPDDLTAGLSVEIAGVDCGPTATYELERLADLRPCVLVGQADPRAEGLPGPAVERKLGVNDPRLLFVACQEAPGAFLRWSVIEQRDAGKVLDCGQEDDVHPELAGEVVGVVNA